MYWFCRNAPFSFLFASVLLAGPLLADTQLTTLPPRETVRIDLAAGAETLVEETRTINLVRGANRVDFAWAGTLIQRESIQLRPLRGPGTVAILSVSDPPAANRLFWTVHSSESGPVKFRISYLIHGFVRKTDYRVIASRDEKDLQIDCRVHLANGSGESFPSSLLQLGPRLRFPDREMLADQVRRMTAFRAHQVPLEKRYLYHPQQGEAVRYFYVFRNAGEGGSLGQQTLEPGKVRVFLRDSTDSEAFLGEDFSGPVAVGREAELSLGLARDIRCQRHVVRSHKEQLVFERWYHVHQELRWTLENFKDETVPLTIREPLDGEWDLRGITLVEVTGERDQRSEKRLSLDSVATRRVHNGLLEVLVKLPPTGDRQAKWEITAEITLLNRGF